MPNFVTPFAETCALTLESLGIVVIVACSVWVLIAAVVRTARREDAEQTFRMVRHRLGRGILLGLEFLVAADIIHTVAVELTFRTVGVLAIIVAIRTFLSFTLELEINGRWPWQHPREPGV